MGLLNSNIVITITGTSRAVTQAGFGVPMIMSHTAAWVERIRFYTTIAAVAVDFATTTPEYLMAAQLFAAEPVAPSRIAIGRCALPATMRWEIGVTTVAHSTAYKVKVGSTTYTYTSDANATNDEIATGLATAIDAHAGMTASTTGSGGSLKVRLVADAAGAWFDVAVLGPDAAYSTDYLSIKQDNADPGVATDLAAIFAANKTWYTVLTPFTSSAIIDAAAAWVDSNKRTMIVATQDSASATAAAGGSDVMQTEETAARARTMVVYHPRNGQFADAAWAGRCLPLQPGSETWAYKQLTGVDTNELTDTQRTNIEDKHGNYVVEFGGVGVSYPGWVSAGTFFDQVRGADWLEARMQEGIAQLLLDANKVPYTNQGVAKLRNKVEAALAAGERVGLLRSGWSTSAELVEDQSDTDRSNRLYGSLTFEAEWAGAIHATNPITGTVTV